VKRHLFITLCLVTCAPPPVPASVALRRDIASIRHAAAAYLHAQTEQQWRAWVGTPATGDDPLAGYGWLFTPSTIDKLRRGIRAEASADGRRALHFVHAFLVSENVNRAVRDLDLRTNARLSEPFELDGQRFTFADITTALAREPDPNRRRRMAEAVVPILDDINPLLAERDRAITRAGALLGYPDRVRLASEIRNYDVRTAADLAKDLLTASDAMYLSALNELAPSTLDVPFERLRRADIPRLSAAPAFADRFPPDRLVSAAAATFLELGIDLDRLPLHVDTDAGLRKNPRAACFPVVVPTDVRLSIKPSGGPGDYGALLHEMGHALHFAFTRTPLFEFQQLGDASVAEAFAFLFEGLADDPAWLAERLHMGEPALTDYVRLAALRRLLMVRRHAAKVLYELEWRSSSEADPRELFARHLSRAYGFPLEAADAAHFLIDHDPFVQSADYLRGWLLAAQLTDALRHRFGATWWKSPAAGAYLRDAWSAGQRDTSEQLAQRLGVDRIDPEPLLGWAANSFIRRASVAGVQPARQERTN